MKSLKELRKSSLSLFFFNLPSIVLFTTFFNGFSFIFCILFLVRSSALTLDATDEDPKEIDFFTNQARLQIQARMALAQAKDIAHMQMEVNIVYLIFL